MATNFKFKVENNVYEWATQFITGREVRQARPGIPQSYDLFLKMHGKTGVLIKDDEAIDLKDPGIEKFYAQQSTSTAG